MPVELLSNRIERNSLLAAISMHILVIVLSPFIANLIPREKLKFTEVSYMKVEEVVPVVEREVVEEEPVKEVEEEYLPEKSEEVMPPTELKVKTQVYEKGEVAVPEEWVKKEEKAEAYIPEIEKVEKVESLDSKVDQDLLKLLEKMAVKPSPRSGKYADLKGEFAFTPVVGGAGGAGGINPMALDPTAIPNLIKELNERTRIKGQISSGISLSSREILNVPIIILAGGRGFRFSKEEKANLKEYLYKGGLLVVVTRPTRGGGDFWHWMETELKDILGGRYVVKEIPKSHAIFDSYYKLKGGTPPTKWNHQPLTGIFLFGRLVVVFAHNAYFGAWADRGAHNPTPQGQELAYELGINLIVYASQRGIKR